MSRDTENVHTPRFDLHDEQHFKLIESAQARWRVVNAPHLVEREPATAA